MRLYGCRPKSVSAVLGWGLGWTPALPMMLNTDEVTYAACSAIYVNFTSPWPVPERDRNAIFGVHLTLYLFTCGRVVAQVWDRNSLECVQVLQGHTGSVLCLQYDDNIIISGSSDATVRFELASASTTDDNSDRKYMELSWFQKTGKVDDRHDWRLRGDHVLVPAIVVCIAKGELMWCHFRTQSQSSSLLQTSYLLCSYLLV